MTFQYARRRKIALDHVRNPFKEDWTEVNGVYRAKRSLLKLPGEDEGRRFTIASLTNYGFDAIELETEWSIKEGYVEHIWPHCDYTTFIWENGDPVLKEEL